MAVAGRIGIVLSDGGMAASYPGMKITIAGQLEGWTCIKFV